MPNTRRPRERLFATPDEAIDAYHARTRHRRLIDLCEATGLTQGQADRLLRRACCGYRDQIVAFVEWLDLDPGDYWPEHLLAGDPPTVTNLPLAPLIEHRFGHDPPPDHLAAEAFNVTRRTIVRWRRDGIPPHKAFNVADHLLDDPADIWPEYDELTEPL